MESWYEGSWWDQMWNRWRATGILIGNGVGAINLDFEGLMHFCIILNLFFNFLDLNRILLHDFLDLKWHALLIGYPKVVFVDILCYQYLYILTYLTPVKFLGIFSVLRFRLFSQKVLSIYRHLFNKKQFNDKYQKLKLLLLW